MIKARIAALRALMKEKQIDAYYIPTSDFHDSEYVGEYFKAREYITGFTGSAGTAVITKTEAGLWTDGRYFVQAAQQLLNSGIELYPAGQPGTPSIEQFLLERLPQNGCLGFDGRAVSAAAAERLSAKLAEKRIAVQMEADLVGVIWEDRPVLSHSKVWLLEQRFTGMNAADKLELVRVKMKEQKADLHVVTSLDDIMWILNIRGNDIPCNPVALSYLVIGLDQARLFIHPKALTSDTKAYFKRLSVQMCGYEEIYKWAETVKDSAVLLEKSRVNQRLVFTLAKANCIFDAVNPSSLMKARKNPVEVENMRQAHIKDGVAVTKFLYWLKQNVGRQPISEISAAEYLEELRRQQGCLEPSFDTISAYQEHGAIVHYHVIQETNRELEPHGLYLIDSGGQYYEGTTDVTRTVVLGEVTGQQREHLTLAAVSMLRLGNAKFLHGCTGISLDYIAREPFWSRGLNYNHGTGHGVGYLLNVHERPNGFRYQLVPERMDSAVLEEGMITSDEPGIYIAGSHGVRIENLILCKKAGQTAYGQFMEFEFLTYVPIDLDGIDKSLMEPKDVEYLNEYHQQVYQKISVHLTAEEKTWLAHYTRPI